MTAPLNRLSARIGSPVDLNVQFLRNGVLEDPFAIRRVDIYVDKVIEENLLAQILVPDPDETGYPLPIVRSSVGTFNLDFDIPCDFQGNRSYFDVWRYIGSEECGAGTDLDDESLWQFECNKFFAFPDGFFVDDGTIIPRFGFEPLDFKMFKPEVRTIEVGFMPLPLYDFDYNRIMPLIPQFRPFITIETEKCEVIVPRTEGRMGCRQGTYRANPFVAQFTLDTSAFLKGTYLYQVHIDLPNGETRVSPRMYMTIA